jgi:hypothetical protein
MLLQPESLEEAQLYIGTTLEKWWGRTPVSEPGWFKCTVTAVTDETLITKAGKREDGLFLHLR